MSRTVNVVRMQLANRQTFLWIPLIILTGSFVLSMAVYVLLDASGVTGPFYGGGAQAPLWYFFAIGIQALTLTFPFSQAMSVTRRQFYLGTLLTAAVTSAVLALVFLIGGLIEEATNGWGLNGWFFRLDWVWEGGPAGAALFYFVVAMLFFVFGFWAATVYKRFGPLGLTIVLVGIGVILVGALWLVGWFDLWVGVFTWFATQGPVGLTLWGVVLLAALGATGWFTLRRAIP